VIIVGTRQCEGDLYDSLKAPEWITKEYRAVVNEERKETLFPEKWPWDKLMGRKDSIVNSPKGGMRIWLKEYMNDVRAIKGNIVKYTDFKFWLKPGENKPETGRWCNNVWEPKPDKLDVYQGWDLNLSRKPTADYTAGLTIGINRANGNTYVLDVYRGRLQFPERLAMMKTKFGQFPETLQVGIENVLFQDDTVQALKRETSMPVVGIHSTANKFARLEAGCTVFTNGKVYVRPEHVDFIEEVVSFPMTQHDDQLDAFDIANMMTRLKRRSRIINMADYAETPAGKEALAKVVPPIELPEGKTMADIYKKISDTEYEILGHYIKLGPDGTVWSGPSWLLGRRLQSAINHAVERTIGLKESNTMYDKGITPGR
jgi:predicted phage terminase large subunit-like protein